LNAAQEHKELGAAYNEFMDRLRPDDWACLIDHDAMFTTTIWHDQMERAINLNPDAGLFVPRTNRIGCGWMKLQGVETKNHDMIYHRCLGRELADSRGATVTDVTIWEEQPSRKPLSGVLMLLSKKVWQQVSGFKAGFLTVDNDMHARIRKAGLKVYLMEGVYLYHWYRFEGRGS